MVLRMADAVHNRNLPSGMDAYAAYIDGHVGDQPNYPSVIASWPNARHLSVSVLGNPADCADVESGAMTSWQGYTVGYCSVGAADRLIATCGRPRKLWTAHYTNVPHICGRACGLTSTEADGTQWTDHGGAWDESLLREDFFDFQQPADNPPSAAPVPQGDHVYYVLVTTDTRNAWIVEYFLGQVHKCWIPDPAALAAFQKTLVTVNATSAEAGGIPSVGPGPTA